MKRSVLAMAILATVAVSADAVARVVVLKATGPSAPRFKTGAALDGNAAISLKSGDVLTLLDARGLRTFRGVRTFVPSRDEPEKSRIKALIDTGDARRLPKVAAIQSTSGVSQRPRTIARTGAVRSVGEAATPTYTATLNAVDLRLTGTQCVAPASELYMVRTADGTDPGYSLAVATPGSRTGAQKLVLRQTMTFGGNEQTGLLMLSPEVDARYQSAIQNGDERLSRLWAVDVAPVSLGDGAQLRITEESSGVERSITLRMVTPPDDNVALYEMLLEKGCTAQAERMISEAAALAPEPDELGESPA